MKVTSQMRLLTRVTPTARPAKAWLRFTFRPLKQIRPQWITVMSWKGYASSSRARTRVAFTEHYHRERNHQGLQARGTEMEDRQIRAELDAHWAASDASEFELEHQIYREDAVLEYPQSGERIRGRLNIQASRLAQPSVKRFAVRRILGAADLWITEFVLTYDGKPSYTVSIMEFKDGKVARETQYFGDAFEPGRSRAQWVEVMR
jgi:hypothetical protein